ncbi:rfbL protein [Devosia limi DSM 17137]|uniref:Acyl-CoA synthetase (AMP-forming)/AMP-acid ligase II n=1 Tax=Devosia limi DSM 17137 TaxID=1121477 RepID=A0A0F5LKP5_9HYPH|nr:AMP-binding protein [Devosia limi]KKB82845.1 rfbL protein [Devosia limi DSM 17137]SHF49141.1 Acyl-CoA synthetase (AMP-forming)/AMP-acid ligase II [Devosia limi DSM 17137]
MTHAKLTATALVTRNSLSYIEHVFALNAAREPLVNVPDEAFAAALTGITIENCIVPDEGSGWFTANHPLIHEDRPAQVTYTSGTEGMPKGIVLTYSNLADAAERIIDQMGLTSEVREYVGVPVTYSFGIGRVRAVSAAGGQCYVPPRGFDPHELARMLKSGEVNALSAVPTLLRIVLQTPTVLADAGKNLRWLEIGSQYMSAAEKSAVRALFPNARIVQHYGLTEASRSTFLQISDVPDDLLESVGRAVGKTEIEISPKGRIQIRGPHVARWRVDADQLVDLASPDGWLETSDLGHISDGYLYYDGRADDLINSGGIKINPDMLEARIGGLLGLGGRIVVAKVPDALRGEGVLVAAESADLSENRLRDASVEALSELGVNAGDALHVQVMATIPRTATGKPLRRLLTEAFAQQRDAAAAAGIVDPVPESGADDVLSFFQKFFPGEDIGPDDSFETMGGDSLSYIQFSLGFEDRFGPLPSGWEGLTVAQLEKIRAVDGGSSWRLLESATLTRAFFMICIVALHLDTFVYSSTWGAAYFLFMLAGYSVMRFQWPEISRTGKVNTIFGTVLRVAIPTVMVIFAMQLLARTFELMPPLLISNWFDPSQYHIAYYYFAEIYMQLLLVIAALLAIPKIRDVLRARPMMTCTALIVVAMVVSWMVDQVWDTNYLYHRTPIWYLWTIGAGMLMASARDMQDRLIAMAIIAVAVFMHHGMSSASAYILGGTALVLFVPEISVPAPVKAIVGEIAGASMFMYLSHFQVNSLITRIFHGPKPWIALFAAIAFGIVFARIYNWMESKVRAYVRSYRAAAINRTPQDAL